MYFSIRCGTQLTPMDISPDSIICFHSFLMVFGVGIDGTDLIACQLSFVRARAGRVCSFPCN